MLGWISLGLAVAIVAAFLYFKRKIADVANIAMEAKEFADELVNAFSENSEGGVMLTTDEIARILKEGNDVWAAFQEEKETDG